ncbi:MAG: hypothetical protein GY780_08960 [bacterium]|nr:hypothetical protein [bacterium]
MKFSLPFFLVVLTSLMMLTSPAYAYIDPGTGSFLVQGLIAGVIAVGVTGKIFWAKIKSLITGKPIVEDEDDDE